MAQLYFYYSAMNAGKTTSLLQSSYNYRERGMHTIVFAAKLEGQNGHGQISSRIGLTTFVRTFSSRTNIYSIIESEHNQKAVHCILVDECHFLSQKQVAELCSIVDNLAIPVLCYGLRTDFRAEPFTGSLYLLIWADKLIELKTICHCGRKANHVLRLDDQGRVVQDGEQIMIGNHDHYVSVCRKHFIEAKKYLTFVPKVSTPHFYE
ncbi:thymidine kinase [Sodalis sp. CWE]|uniref:thymidine kinase n=1 Tax=Sodalis sp. CWE TaxID=2803816 RepID=UPI001C7DB6E3|nr:thymidine kinase [Sodalis sp. CWE]MBX4181171.1 thymidine kinase [Sodalis sp. CWE]